MFLDYLKESRGVDSIEKPYGFATYIIQGEACYIEDIYVRPEQRKTDAASNMADEIKTLAKEKGCKYLTGSVNGLAIDPTTSVIVLAKYGFKISKVVDNAIFFKMEI